MTYPAVFSLLFLTAFFVLAVMVCARTILRRKANRMVRPHRPPSPGKGTVDAEILYCNFCGKDQHSVRKLITGSEANICDECAGIFAREVRGVISRHWIAAGHTLPKLAAILAFLDRHLAGDPHGKRRLAFDLHTYFRSLRCNAHTTWRDLSWPKPNILLAGSDGAGKWKFVQDLADCFGVPFETINAADFTDCRHFFARLNDVATALDRSADTSSAWAGHAIVYIDGLEKMRRVADESCSPPSGETGQTALAGLLGGSVYRIRSTIFSWGDPFVVPGPLARARGRAAPITEHADEPESGAWGPADAQRALIEVMTGLSIWIEGKPTSKHPDNDLNYIDTKDIIFICAVAPDRQAVSSPSWTGKAGTTPSRQDLYRFGFVPDLIDCLPRIFVMDGPHDG